MPGIQGIAAVFTVMFWGCLACAGPNLFAKPFTRAPSGNDIRYMRRIEGSLSADRVLASKLVGRAVILYVDNQDGRIQYIWNGRRCVIRSLDTARVVRFKIEGQGALALPSIVLHLPHSNQGCDLSFNLNTFGRRSEAIPPVRWMR